MNEIEFNVFYYRFAWEMYTIQRHLYQEKAFQVNKTSSLGSTQSLRRNYIMDVTWDDPWFY